MSALARRLPACLLAGLLVLAATPPAQAQQSADLPVAGTFDSQLNHTDDDPVAQLRGAVHAVRRVPGGTAVYFSLGVPAGQDFFRNRFQEPPALDGPYGVSDVFQVRLLDLQGLRVYLPLYGSSCLCSSTTDFDDADGVLSVGYALYAPLPPTVTSVTVKVGYALVDDVPVEDGPLEPVGEGAPLALGAGWPQLPDAAAVAAVPDPARFVLPLVRHTSDVKKTVTVNEQPERVDEDLSADVLFAVGRSELTPAAQAALQQVAARVKARAKGPVTVVGHTDDTGSDTSNQALSEARARSVRDALARLLGPGVTLQASGKGEQEPVADNASPDGRQANRRVTVTYGVEGLS